MVAPENPGKGGDGFSQPTYHHIHGPDQSQSSESNPTHQLPPWQGAPEQHSTRQLPPVPGPGPAPGTAPGSAAGNGNGNGNVTVTRAVVARSRYFSKLLANKVISASEADGAKESGLTALIWNQVMSYGSDAMVTVALAGTVFFSAPSEAQRGNVLLYLLMTMAPFAVVAPIIGPALDRVQHGRRWVMAGTAIGRAILAVVMAQNFTDLYVLFPAALGSLVLSKAYSVIRSAAAPRLVPSNLTLVEANARLSIFGLAAALIGGGIVGVAIKLSGSYPFGLWITAAAFTVTGFYSFRLPKIVDALPPAARPANETGRPLRKSGRRRSTTGGGYPGEHPTGTAQQPNRSQSVAAELASRFAGWATRGYSKPVVLALQGECTLRWLSGFLTLFLAFYVESMSHGWRAVASLGAVGVAAGAGNFAGTAIGTRLKLARPDLIVLVCTSGAAVACLVTALFFSLPMAIIATLASGITNSLAKLSLDSIIQRDVGEDLRSSAFGRSETFLQLSWVFGATIAILLPAKNGQLGFIVAASLTIVVAIFIALRERAVAAEFRGRNRTEHARRSLRKRPGNLNP